ncbi:hypothetical protein MRX96_004740 [Rhipicephalus microplus]
MNGASSGQTFRCLPRHDRTSWKCSLTGLSTGTLTFGSRCAWILADTSRRNFTFHVRHSASLQRWSKERASMQDGEQYMAFVTAYARELGASESEELDPMVMDVVEAEPEIEKILSDFPWDSSKQQKSETKCRALEERNSA